MTAIIYSGFLRSWEKVKQNQIDNIWSEDTMMFFYTYDKPDCNRLLNFYKQIEDSIIYFPQVLRINMRLETSIGNTLNQWRNRRDAFKIISNEYNVVAICRTDIEFSGKINMVVQPGKIYIPSGCDYGGVNDQFAYGDYDAMKVYCSLYDHYRTYFNEGLIFHPETYLKRHLLANGIEIVRIAQTNKIVRQ